MKNFLLYFFALAACLTLLPLAPKLLPIKSEEQVELIHVLNADSGEVYTLPTEDYVIGVLEAAQYPYEGEALKAIAVAVRSRAVYCEQNRPIHEEAAVCDNPGCCEVFTADLFSEQAVGAAAETKGILVTYDGKAAAAITHVSSGTYTASSESIYGVPLPYLTEVRNVAENRVTERTWSSRDFFALLGLSEQTDPNAIVLAYDKSERVRTAELGALTLSGEELANRLSLPSCCFTLTYTDGTVRARCHGVGDGVGMSLTGASILADDGMDFRGILTFYYPETEIKSVY